MHFVHVYKDTNWVVYALHCVLLHVNILCHVFVYMLMYGLKGARFSGVTKTYWQFNSLSHTPAHSEYEYVVWTELCVNKEISFIHDQNMDYGIIKTIP